MDIIHVFMLGRHLNFSLHAFHLESSVYVESDSLLAADLSRPPPHVCPAPA